MLAKPLLKHILADEALTRGLSDPEARMLVEWVVDHAELRTSEVGEEDHDVLIRVVCRRARSIARFVGLWCHQRERGAACQLAAAERFHWPLPTHWNVDPCELMQSILIAETTTYLEAAEAR
jgi:hypothetical protein